MSSIIRALGVNPNKKPLNPKKQRRNKMTVDEFNEWYELGQPVILVDDFGKEHVTKTTSPAWDMCGSAVVKVEGRSGGYDLDRIKPMETHK